MLQSRAFYFLILKQARCSFPAKSNGVVALVMSLTEEGSMLFTSS
jgi:hypothetical protein